MYLKFYIYIYLRHSLRLKNDTHLSLFISDVYDMLKEKVVLEAYQKNTSYAMASLGNIPSSLIKNVNLVSSRGFVKMSAS